VAVVILVRHRKGPNPNPNPRIFAKAGRPRCDDMRHNSTVNMHRPHIDCGTTNVHVPVLCTGSGRTRVPSVAGRWRYKTLRRHGSNPVDASARRHWTSARTRQNTRTANKHIRSTEKWLKHRSINITNRVNKKLTSHA